MKTTTPRRWRRIETSERRRILQMRAGGMSYYAIGPLLDRSTTVVRRVCLGTDSVRRQEAINAIGQPAGHRLAVEGEHAGDAAVLVAST